MNQGDSAEVLLIQTEGEANGIFSPSGADLSLPPSTLSSLVSGSHSATRLQPIYKMGLAAGVVAANFTQIHRWLSSLSHDLFKACCSFSHSGHDAALTCFNLQISGWFCTFRARSG